MRIYFCMVIVNSENRKYRHKFFLWQGWKKSSSGKIGTRFQEKRKILRFKFQWRDFFPYFSLERVCIVGFFDRRTLIEFFSMESLRWELFSSGEFSDGQFSIGVLRRLSDDSPIGALREGVSKCFLSKTKLCLGLLANMKNFSVGVWLNLGMDCYTV